MAGSAEVNVSMDAGAQQAVLPLPLQERLLTLLDQHDDEADAALISFYFSLTLVQAGEALLLITARQNYDEVRRFFVFRPDVNVNYANAVGDTALHVAFAARPIDFSIINLLCDKGGLLDTKNGKQLAPLQLCYSLPDNPADILHMLIEHWHNKLALSLMQEIFEEASRRQWYRLSSYLLDKFQGQLNVKATPDLASDNQPIHALVLAKSFDSVVLTQLRAAGVTLQDQNKAGKTVLDLLLDTKAYDRMALLATRHADEFTLDELIKIFQTLLSMERYDLCKNVLIAQASHLGIDRNYLKQMLGHTARHMPLTAITRVLTSLWKEYGFDASLLKFIDVAMDADIVAKKQAAVTLCRGVIQKMNNPDEVLALVNALEAQTQFSTTPNLKFLHDREQVSVHGHAWKGQPASGTWVTLMREAQGRCATLTSGHPYHDKMIEFLSQRTTEGLFGLFCKKDNKPVSAKGLEQAVPAKPVSPMAGQSGP